MAEDDGDTRADERLDRMIAALALDAERHPEPVRRWRSRFDNVVDNDREEARSEHERLSGEDR